MSACFGSEITASFKCAHILQGFLLVLLYKIQFTSCGSDVHVNYTICMWPSIEGQHNGDELCNSYILWHYYKYIIAMF